MRKEFVLSNMEIGLITAIPSLASVLFTLPVGWMSDRYGAREVVDGSLSFNQDLCFGRGLCVSTCPTNAITLVDK